MNGFAKRDTRRVKQVVLPKGGQSYNPKADDHKVLLKQVADTEQDIIDKEMAELRKNRPSLFEDADSDSDKSDAAEDEESSDSSDDAPIDPATVPVKREDVKTRA